MRLFIGTSKGLVVLDPNRGAVPLMALAEPPSIWCMVQDCKDPNILYAGSNLQANLGSLRGAGTLSRSSNGGRTWADITPRGATDEDVWAVATPPDRPNTVYVGTSHARLFVSENAGRGFEECKSFQDVPGRGQWTFPPPPHIAHVRSISFDPSNPATMYIGVEEGGVIRSRDRGKTFEVLNSGIYTDIHNVAVDPNDSKRLYATTGKGFYRSEDNGGSWTLIKEGFNRSYTVPLLAHSRQAGTIYTAAAAGPPPTWGMGGCGADAVMYRSVDHGHSFRPISVGAGPLRGMVMGIAQSPEDPDGLYAALSDGSILRSGDRGEQMTVIASKLPPAYALLASA